jgi:hypothetical protein
MHLKVDYWGAQDTGNNKHAQEIIKDLGITYQHSTPQSMSDSWWFWNCKNIPEKLPEYVRQLNTKAMCCIGWGLSEEMAKAIAENE